MCNSNNDELFEALQENYPDSPSLNGKESDNEDLKEFEEFVASSLYEQPEMNCERPVTQQMMPLTKKSIHSEYRGLESKMHYKDFSMETEESFQNKTVTSLYSDDINYTVKALPTKRKSRRRFPESFPLKLHRLLEAVEYDGFGSIISWLPHGRAFMIHKPHKFTDTIAPQYFQHTKFTSFQRQLNLYNFRRITHGKDAGSYYHELFLRGRPFLCTHMARIKVKGKGIKAPIDPESEPDFYLLPYVAEIPKSFMVDYREQVTSTPISPDPIPRPRTVSEGYSVASQDDDSIVSLIEEERNMLTKQKPNQMDSANGNRVLWFEGKPFHYLDTSEVISGSAVIPAEEKEHSSENLLI